ncbi:MULTISPECIES: cyclase family protein [Spongiibacter]|uniref:cyclase family protein n=1 Tax=Spongiibacter TaxID=630749 RepID=UPI0003B3C128|nr:MULTISPECIES: cyclase family protein [Spongiibacter]MAY39364.1 cyclase [Spongiibacter sp.]MBI58926.1 cyclase [Spongiibacter sp.]MBU73828.1 cyclase [Spongiibacter sp.]|tara:strand:- start:948 stop:1598 length:651 start_codon:yes stop_codon:yes gene_type:complete
MKIYDITLDIEPGMLYWHEGKTPEVMDVTTIKDGAPSNVTRWLIGSHTGTHIDAPRHFIDDGATVEQLPIEMFVGRTRVMDLIHIGDRAITADDIKAIGLDGVTRVLFKTTNSAKRMIKKEFSDDWVGIAPCAAQYLVDNGVQFVGIDYVTIEAPEHSVEWPTHHILCGNNVIILEGAKVGEIPDGEYFMCCLPMRLKGSEGAATRTILIDGITEG